MATPHLTVVVPAYNEAARILPALARVHEYLSAQPYRWSVLVVSDGSTDGTDELVREFAGTHAGFALHRVSPNRGKGCAVREGMLRSRGARAPTPATMGRSCATACRSRNGRWIALGRWTCRWALLPRCHYDLPAPVFRRRATES